MSPFLGCWDCIAKLDRKKGYGSKWSKNRENNSYVGWSLDVFGPIFNLYDEGASGRKIEGKGDLIAGGKIMRLWGISSDYVMTCVIMNNDTIEFEDGSSRNIGEHMFCEMLCTKKEPDGHHDSLAAYIFVRH